MHRTAWLTILGLIGSTWVTPPLRADIVTYTNGTVVKGLVEDAPEDPTSVFLTTDRGRIMVPRSRIQSIQRESPSMGYVHIGQGYFDRGMLAEALGAFQRALSLDNQNAEARRLLDATQARISEQQRLNRAQAVERIDQIEREVNQMVARGEFEPALERLKEASRLVPEPEQKARLQKLISRLYLAWAEEREDKYDKINSEKYLNLALAADPGNQDVIDKMLRLWENDPDKREQVANVYQTMLDRNPGDRALEKKLADLQWDLGRTEDAVRHYLKLYQEGEQWRGSAVEERIIDGLDRLHRQFARDREYDKAIAYYKILAAIDPQTDPTAVVLYEYLKRSAQTPPDDPQAQLALAQFAEQNGLDREALDAYRRLAADTAPEREAVRKAAQEGIDRYARRALADAQARFQSGDYHLALTLADRAREEFKTSTQVVEALTELIGRANAEIARDTRQKRDLARDVLKRADEFYGIAMQHFNNIFDTQRANIPTLSSPREEAKRYFTYAIQAYEEALKIDPSLGTDSQSLVQIRLNECREYYRRLTQPMPPPRYRIINRPVGN